jgi:hypothetical protein
MAFLETLASAHLAVSLLRILKPGPKFVASFLAFAIVGSAGMWERPMMAATLSSVTPNLLEGTTSDAAKKDAVQSIPMNKLPPEDRARVESVIQNVSIFRRMPVKVVDCNPDMYLFLVRHPDVVVNIWELMNVSHLQLRQTDENQYKLVEPAGTVAQFSYIYRSHDTHILYGEGSYEGPLMSRPAKGRGVLVLKCGYVRETNGRYYVTSRLDSFMTIEPFGVELLGKTVSPIMGKTVDNNFAQTVAFVGSLSRTAEVNSRGVQRLAMQLKHVSPDVREQFADVAAKMSPNSATAGRELPARDVVAARLGN